MEINTNKLVDFTLPDSEIIFDCQFHPNMANCIGFCTVEGEIQILKFENNFANVVSRYRKHHKGSSIRKIRFHDELMFSAAKTIKITDLHQQKVVRVIDNDKTKIYSLLVADDYLICAGDDEGNFKVWDYRSERPIHMSLHECDGYISDLDIDSQRRIVVASSGEGTLTAFNLRSRRMEQPQSELFESGFQCIRFVEEKDKVIVGCEDGVLNIFNKNEWGNISDRFPIKQNTTGLNSIDCLEMLDELNVVFGCSDGTLQMASLFPHQPLNVITNQNSGIESLDVNQISKQVVATSLNNIKLFSYEINQSDGNNVNNKKGNKLTTVKGDNFFADLA